MRPLQLQLSVPSKLRKQVNTRSIKLSPSLPASCLLPVLQPLQPTNSTFEPHVLSQLGVNPTPRDRLAPPDSVDTWGSL
jgi:hypothetical protein